MTATINASTSGGGGIIQTADASGILALQTGGTTAVTINDSQNVGIGTSSPASGSGGGLSIGTTSSGKSLHLYASTYTGSGLVNFFGTDGAVKMQMGASGSTSAFVYGSAGVLQLGGNGSETARITSGGYFKASNAGTYLSSAGTYHELVSSTSGSDSVAIVNTSAGPYGIYVAFTGAAPNNTTNYFVLGSDTGATRFVLRSNGGLANYSANNVNLSDSREKTNASFAGEYLAKICAIPVRTYNYIDQNLEEDDGLTLGVYAQDVQAVAPELVTESNWGTEEAPKMRLSIYQTDMQYALMKCIQEQQAIITTLTERISALEAK